MAGEIFDSPNPWVAAHIRRFAETNGTPRPGVSDLLLITRGRRSGKLRRTALAYAREDDRYVVVASNAGADRHPAWFLNLCADPNVTIQVGTETLPARARIAPAEEGPGLWQLMITMMPSYRKYQEATTREIPVVILEPST
ncbi:nitroreductase family deazaflavin-dependent oxidoreductase [Actinoplanes teichomyceticus]|uniref:Deazaflavin-dependent oxidoreductase (Nitroreductase family) n=1 Tax=Actinoplanes teichomyceticus TaxID=1867 RepID=A0A561WAD6_ACTTI|nr:nitroreductase family deazaflavin-dependent oxidoreductase [Actinoplanes teichomyceticus]TWG20822.1 deazaflavin-dependent oxidoreductase (nitroreductase family) [Actinoplanes teichomyceticus]GIF14479.1 nitroreductase [Actinoplanes teichomyceticus]